jgi:hypothetical protein
MIGKKGYNGESFSFLIRKEERMGDPKKANINQKGSFNLTNHFRVIAQIWSLQMESKPLTNVMLLSAQHDMDLMKTSMVQEEVCNTLVLY